MDSSHPGKSSDAWSFERERILHDDRDEVDGAVGELLEALRGHGFEESSIFAIRLAVEEGINNGFRHGNKCDPDKVVRFRWFASPSLLRVEVEDEGEGFDPCCVPDPTAEENLEIPSGRGLMLMKAYMSHVEYLDPGNRVRMRFERDAPE